MNHTLTIPCPYCRFTSVFNFAEGAAFIEGLACTQCERKFPEATMDRARRIYKRAQDGNARRRLTIRDRSRMVLSIEDTTGGRVNRNQDFFPEPLGTVLSCTPSQRPIFFEHVEHPRFFDVSLVQHHPRLNFEVLSDRPLQVGMAVGVDPKTGMAIPFEVVEDPATSPSIKERTREGHKRQVFMRIAETIAELGTCQRLKVGCVLLNSNGGVAAVGYNGAGPGMSHCDPEKCGPGKRCLRCSHAEENAVANLACEPHIAYVTHEPCNACTRKLIRAGVRHIFYRNPYTSMAEDEASARQEWLVHYNVTMERLEV